MHLIIKIASTYSGNRDKRVDRKPISESRMKTKKRTKNPYTHEYDNEKKRRKKQ